MTAKQKAYAEAADMVEDQKMTSASLYALPDHKVRASVNAALDTVVWLLRTRAGVCGYTK